MRALADRLAARSNLGIRLVPFRRTRGRCLDDGRVRTFEVQAEQGELALSRDGLRAHAFAYGPPPMSVDDEKSGTHWSSWSVATGELLDARAVGQFRDLDGCFAVDAAETLLAVRAHRDVHVHDLERSRIVGTRRALDGSEGPHAMTFLDDGTLVADDASYLKRWDARAGTCFGSVPSIAWNAHVVDRRRSCILAGGSRAFPGVVEVLALPDLTRVGVFRAEVDGALQRPRQRPGQVFVDDAGVHAIDVSDRWIVTGHGNGDVLLWPRDAVRAGGTLASPCSVATRRIGTHEDWVASVRIVEDVAVVAAGFDGLIRVWPLVPKGAPPRVLDGPSWSRASLFVQGDRRLSGLVGGQAVLWDARALDRIPAPPLRRGRPRGMRVRGETIEIAVGDDLGVFSRDGELLDVVAGPPEDIDTASAEEHVDFLDFVPPPLPDIAPPNYRVVEGGAEIDLVAMERYVGWLPVDARTIVTLDHDFHVTFWRRYDA